MTSSFFSSSQEELKLYLSHHRGTVDQYLNLVTELKIRVCFGSHPQLGQAHESLTNHNPYTHTHTLRFKTHKYHHFSKPSHPPSNFNRFLLQLHLHLSNPSSSSSLSLSLFSHLLIPQTIFWVQYSISISTVLYKPIPHLTDIDRGLRLQNVNLIFSE